MTSRTYEKLLVLFFQYMKEFSTAALEILINEAQDNCEAMPTETTAEGQDDSEKVPEESQELADCAETPVDFQAIPTIKELIEICRKQHGDEAAAEIRRFLNRPFRRADSEAKELRLLLEISGLYQKYKYHKTMKQYKNSLQSYSVFKSRIKRSGEFPLLVGLMPYHAAIVKKIQEQKGENKNGKTSSKPVMDSSHPAVNLFASDNISASLQDLVRLVEEKYQHVSYGANFNQVYQAFYKLRFENSLMSPQAREKVVVDHNLTGSVRDFFDLFCELLDQIRVEPALAELIDYREFGRMIGVGEKTARSVVKQLVIGSHTA